METSQQTQLTKILSIQSKVQNLLCVGGENNKKENKYQNDEITTLREGRIVISDNTLKVFKNNNKLEFEIQAEEIVVIENDNHIEISIENNTNETKHIGIYKVELSNTAHFRLSAIKAVKKTLNLGLREAKDLCDKDPTFVYQTNNKEKAIEIWSVLKSKLLHTNIETILHEQE